MKLSIRRVGNSLGVIIPRAVLRSWGLGEGDSLHLGKDSIHASSPSAHEALDELKRKLAMAVVAAFTPRQIRSHGLANLHRWRESGAWVSAYGEWKEILEGGDDGALFAAMLGRDERATRLRQSAPYVGLLPRDEVKRLNEEATR